VSVHVVTRTKRGWAVLNRSNGYVVSECFETPEEARERAEQMNARPSPAATVQTTTMPERG
jgi:hypothetical protein